MSLTGAQLLTGFSNFLDDDWSSTTTSAGLSGGTTLVDTALRRYGDDALIDWFLRPTGATNTYAIRSIRDFAGGTGTCTVAPAFAAQAPTSEVYELHEYDPRRKFAALDSAILALTGKIPQIIYDETITLDGISTEFAIPSTVRKGPIVVQIEEPLSVDTAWNNLSNPRGDSTTDWTVSGAGASAAVYTAGDYDLLIPKYDASCMSLTVPTTTLTTHRQTVSAMSNITATAAAQRRMTFAMWIYARVASRIRIEIVDDNGQVAQSGLHQGKGWELLSVTGTISAGNATTLTVGITVSSSAAALRLFWNRAWFFYGDQMPTYYTDESSFLVRRDDTTQKIILPRGLAGKRNLRLIGSGPLSLLGTTAATQVTNTVEVDANTAEVLYAKAAQILIGNELLATPRYAEVLNRVRVGETRGTELERAWMHTFGDTPRIRGPYG